MIRLLVRTLIALVANTVGLLVAAALLDGMHVDFGSFVLAVIIFTVAFALMQPFLVSQFRRGNSAHSNALRTRIWSASTTRSRDEVGRSQ